jgi:hypothetical protein
MSRETDAEIETLVQWLSAQGFSLSREQYSKQDFGNWFREFHGPDIWLRLTRERGEWLIAATTAGATSWFSLDAWERCLARESGKEAADRQAPPDGAFLQRRLHAMRYAAVADASSLRRCLEAAQKDMRMHGRPSLPPEAFARGAMLSPDSVSEEMRQEASARLARRSHNRRRKG